MLLEHVLGKPRSWLLAHDDEVLEERQLQAFLSLYERRQRGEPMAYLVGIREFMGLELHVTPDVLIPRPETELLVEIGLAAVRDPLSLESLPSFRSFRSPQPSKLSQPSELFRPSGSDSPLPSPPQSSPQSPRQSAPLSDPSSASTSASTSAPAPPSLLSPPPPPSLRPPQPPQPLQVLDLGTGSGAIAIAIASARPDVQVTAVDVSPVALDVAKANAARLGVNVRFLVSDWFDGLNGLKPTVGSAAICANPSPSASTPASITTSTPTFTGTSSTTSSTTSTQTSSTTSSHTSITTQAPNQTAEPSSFGSSVLPDLPTRFDLILSNPPYIDPEDPHLSHGDLRFEPRNALTDGHDGLQAIRQIISASTAWLRPGGSLWLEHGYDQASAVANLLRDAGFQNVQTHRDLAGHDRVTGGWLLDMIRS